MPGLHVDDHRGVFMSLVQQEFVDAQDPGLPLRLDQSLAVYGVAVAQPLQVYLLDRVLADGRNLAHHLEGEPT